MKSRRRGVRPTKNDRGQNKEEMRCENEIDEQFFFSFDARRGREVEIVKEHRVAKNVGSRGKKNH